MALRAQRVSRLRDAQFGNRAQIARVKLADFDKLPTLHNRKVSQPLRLAASVIFHASIGSYGTADHLKERDPPGKWIDHGFVDIERRWVSVVEFARDNSGGSISSCAISGVAPGVAHRQRGPLLRTRSIDLQKVEQVVRADIP